MHNRVNETLFLFKYFLTRDFVDKTSVFIIYFSIETTIISIETTNIGTL